MTSKFKLNLQGKKGLMKRKSEKFDIHYTGYIYIQVTKILVVGNYLVPTNNFTQIKYQNV